MATIPLSSIDRSPGEVNPGLDPGIYVPPPEPTRPTTYAPGNVTPAQNPTNNTEVLAAATGTNITPNQPTYISVSENGNLVLGRVTNLNFTGVVSVTAGEGPNVTVDINSAANWGFNGNTIFNLNGGDIQNGDLSHGATSFISIPGNGSGIPVSILNYYGNITLTPSLNTGATYTWIFDRNGNLTMPRNTSSINYANGQPYGGGGGGNYGDANVVSLLSNFGSNSISTTGNISGALVAPDGNSSVLVNVDGIIGAAPSFNYDSDAGMLFVGGVTATGNLETGQNSIYGGLSGGFTQLGSTVIAQFTSNVASYSQINIQNISSENLSSADYVITADNGTDSTYYLDIGLAGSTHNDPDFFGDTTSVNDAYIYVTATDQAGPSLSSGPGNLIIGSTNGTIKMFVGNTAQANVVQTVASDGVSIVGNIVGITANNNGYLQWVGNSSGDGAGYTTLRLIPDDTRESADSYLIIDPTGPSHIHIRAGGAQDASGSELFLGGENSYFKVGAGANAATRIASNGYSWEFGTAGQTVPPALNVARGDNPSGTISGYTLNLGDGSQEAIITTPDGDADGNPNSQRIVINPGKGADTTYGEGGDIYLWAGRGGNAGGSGGDIKIRGGQGMLDGGGGYIRVEGGDSQGAGAGGYITLIGGTSATSTGGYVQIQSGQGVAAANIDITGGTGTAGPGGNINITGGVSANGLAEYGNIYINSGASQWKFGNDGNLTLPGNISGNTGGYTIGYRDIPQVTFSANANAALSDAGKHYYSTTAGNLQLTLQDDSNIAFQTGATLTVVVNAAGNVLVNQASGVSLYMAGSPTTGNRVVGAYGMATVMKVAANTWVINGTGVY